MMTDPTAEASDADRADQALPVDDSVEEADPFDEHTVASAEANPADLLEQQQSVPPDDDDYDR